VSPVRYELGFISQKTPFFIVTAVKTTNPTWCAHETAPPAVVDRFTLYRYEKRVGRNGRYLTCACVIGRDIAFASDTDESRDS
jgi:hypothetical protein